MLFKTALLSAMATLATAYTQPDYSKDPSGNAIIKPGANDVVTAGQPYTIQWEPTTQGPISLVLLRGPASNVKPIVTLAEGIANSGHFNWTPDTTLEPDTTHYGLLLVVEGSGQYQYSTQFGVKNDKPRASSSAPVSSPFPVTTDAPETKDAGQFNQQTIYSTKQFVTTNCPKCSAEASSAATAVASSSAIATAPAAASTFASLPVIASSSSCSSSSASSAAATSSVPLIPSSVAAATASSSAGASASASSSAPSSLFTGAADRNTVGMGAVAAGVLAAMVL